MSARLDEQELRIDMWPSLRWVAVGLAALITSSCASDYVARTRGFRAAYEAYDYPRALELIDREQRSAPGIDELLVLLDRGMTLHAAGRYAESIEVLGKADRLSAQLDFVSVSEEAGTLLSNERQRVYRGEDFEKLMISVLQALNYFELGKEEDALVEVRRVNERLKKMVSEEKKPYEQLAIARYLGGVLYESQGEWDSAFIDYYDAHKLSKGRLGELSEPLLRLAKKTGRDDAYRELLAAYPDVAHEPLGKGEGQVIVVVEAGRSPEKEPSERRERLHVIAVPRYRPRGEAPRVAVRVGPEEREAEPVTSLAAVAQQHLDERLGPLIAKALASTAVKAGVAAGLGALAKDERIGAAAFLLLLASNQADLRSWLSLPAELQVARFRVPPGAHDVVVEARGSTRAFKVTVTPGGVQLVVHRVF